MVAVKYLSVKSAKIHSHAGLFQTKPDVYIELSVDGQEGKRTDTVHRTLHPTWNKSFTV